LVLYIRILTYDARKLKHKIYGPRYRVYDKAEKKFSTGTEFGM